MVTDSIEWAKLSTGAYCNYKNNPAMASIYGRLYNYYTIFDPKNLCPKGWHVPSDKEWQILIDYLGGDKVAGEKLKEKGNAHWLENIGATNQSGFSALPAGERDCYIQVDGKKSSFDWLGLRTFFASSTEWGNTIIWVRDLQNLNGGINRIHGGGCSGISVRCIKD